MKFASFIHQGRAGWGAVTDGGIIDLVARTRRTGPPCAR